MWYWDIQSDIRSVVAESFFTLTSVMINKQYEIYDCSTVPYDTIDTITDSFFDVMTKEITARLLQEIPLTYVSDSLQFDGYLAKPWDLNMWQKQLPYYFFNSFTATPSIHTVMSLSHHRSPFANTFTEINTYVLQMKLSWKILLEKTMEVHLLRSQVVTKSNYDFRKKGTLDYTSISIYSFDVKESDLIRTLFITFEITKVYTPVSATVMICQDMQSLDSPLQRGTLEAQGTFLTMMISPGELPVGTYLLVIVDTNSYENQWARYNDVKDVSQSGVEYDLGVWWSDCFVWDQYSWVRSYCQVLNTTVWNSVHCLCSSVYTIYGAVSDPLLTAESKMAVNELMLVSTYVALYFIIVLLVLYILFVLFLCKRERTLVKRRNLWLKDNDYNHDCAYLLTINTGTQRNAGTSSSVYAILHGTNAMSATRELQSKEQMELFARGSVCSFIWTSPEPLGDILSVQLWHDDCGDLGGWFVCEVSVADLVTGSTFVYPCYRWLSVRADDAQVMREITLVKPTTILQDFEHFVPQYVSEYTIWYSLFSSAKFFRLQSLTIFVTVWLVLGTVALNVVQDINSSHTMMTPDPHIETLYYGLFIAILLLPVQWILRFVFKTTNVLDERAFYNRIVKDMVKKSETSKKKKKKPKKENSYENSIYNPEAPIWKYLAKFAESFGIMDLDERYAHPTFVKLVNEENKMKIQQRKIDLNTLKISEDNHPENEDETFPPIVEHPTHFNEKKAEPNDKEIKKDDYVFQKANQKTMKKFNLKKYIKNIFDYSRFVRAIGWIFVLLCVGLCTLWLLKEGSGMPKDYSSLWIQTVFTTMCASALITQPFVITLFTIYKVYVYRRFGYKGIGLFSSVHLEQALTVWRFYRDKLENEDNGSSDENNSCDDEDTVQKRLKDIQRERTLRFARPPPEQQLLKHRNRLLSKDRISSLIRSFFSYIGFMILLILITHNIHTQERFYLNKSLRNSAVNGSCIQTSNMFYKSFTNITSREDWWKWAHSELLDLTYNYDTNYSAYKLFCDSNSIIIGTPRIRRYTVEAEPCVAEEFPIEDDVSVTDLLGIKNCFPDYKDKIHHVHSFSDTTEDDLDAHYLSVVHGFFSRYSSTNKKFTMPKNRIFAVLLLLSKQVGEWILDKDKTRAIITEFTLFHPQSRLYSSVEFIAEFPAVSGSFPSIAISSTAIDKYDSYLAHSAKLAEFFLIALSMLFLKRTCIQLYKNRGKFWSTSLGVLDFCTTILCWVYIICLMLRVHIAENLLWELKITYYQKYVNIKSLVTWDAAISAVAGMLLAIHIIRCLWLCSFITKLRIYGEVLLKGTKEAFKMSVGVFFFIAICAHLGLMLFGSSLLGFHSFIYSFVTVVQTVVLRTSFYGELNNYTGMASVLLKLFFFLVSIFLFFMIFGIFKAVFIYAMKHHVRRSRPDDITWEDIKSYFRESWNSLQKRFGFKHHIEKIEKAPQGDTSTTLYLAEMEALIEKLSNKVDLLMESVDDTQMSDEMNKEELLISESTIVDSEDDHSSNGSLAYSEQHPVGYLDIDPEEYTGIQEPVNYRAFDEITSCPSEMAPTTVNLLSEFYKNEVSSNVPSIDNREHMSKFLEDVRCASTEFLRGSSHGKYGKSVFKIKKNINFLPFISEFSLPNDPNSPDFSFGNNMEDSLIENESEKEEKFFSPIPLVFDGMEKLLAKYCDDDDDDDNNNDNNDDEDSST